MGLSRRRFRLEGYYQHHPHASGKVVQALLEERCGVRVSVTYLNRAQAALTRATRRGENQPGAWQDGAGGLFLLAAAAGSNLLPALRIWGCGYGSAGFPRRMCKSEDSVKQNLSNYMGESTSTFASEKGPPLADVERLKGNRRRELRNETVLLSGGPGGWPPGHSEACQPAQAAEGWGGLEARGSEPCIERRSFPLASESDSHELSVQLWNWSLSVDGFFSSNSSMPSSTNVGSI